MKKITLLFAIFAIVLQSVMAQTREITGTVTSAQDQSPVPGVSVAVKGTTVGTVTDIFGKFNLKVSDNMSTLTFSFIGMKTQEIVLTNATNYHVAMEEDFVGVDEVLVVGYNSVKKADLTSAISTVKSEKLQFQTIGSIDNALQGASTGVQVVNENGRPGGTAYIRIRGTGSSNASNEPLFIIDGIQMASSASYNTINPNDIERVTILKDAAATSIYGARASNGVVLVTTKLGNPQGQAIINYNFQYGYKEMIPLNFDMMNKEQKLQYELELGMIDENKKAEIMNDLSAPETDWQDVVLRRGAFQSHNLSFSKSKEDLKYFFSLSSFREDGISVGSKFERLSGRSNVEIKTNDWLTVGEHLTVSLTDEEATRDRSNAQNPFAAMFRYNPYEPEYLLDENGDYLPDGNGEKQYNLTHEGISISEALVNNPETHKTGNIMGDLYASAEPVRNLVLKSTLAANYRRYTEEYFIYPGSVVDDYVGDPDAPGSKSDRNYDRTTLQWTNIAQYDFTWNDIHSFSALAGTEYSSYDYYYTRVDSKGYASPDLPTQDNAAEVTDGSTTREEWALWSQFAQMRYNYKEKYLATFNIRRDGSSRFGSANKYGIFYAGSIGWNLLEEDFMKNERYLSQLKLRGSAGTSGNLPSELYAAQPLFNYTSYNKLPASTPRQLANTDLKWEKNFNYSLGVDFGFLKNRLSGSIDYYTRITDDLLFDVALSQTTGWSSTLQNVGKISNRGIEIELNGVLIHQKDLQLTAFGSVTTVKNEVEKLFGGQDIINAYSSITILREGLAANTFYLPRYAGVNPANGEPLYYNADGEITNSFSYDYSVALEGKSPAPKYFGNFGLNARYKGFELDANFFYQGGNYIFNYAHTAVLMSDGENASDNQRVDAFNYWKQPGDVNVLPKPSTTNNVRDLDRYLQKGDFIRLRNLTFSYSLPKDLVRKIKMQDCKIYIQGNNIWTFNPYVDGDPEVGRGSAESDLNLMGEFTMFTYPNTRSFTVGLNITF